ncbi:MAG: Kelch repeat-containing protein [Candidatus Hodarchaeales archaeon]|jgi:hypothetical protein
MAWFDITTKIIFILVVSSFFAGSLDSSAQTIDIFVIRSSDIITEDADEFLEGSMDNLILDNDRNLSLNKTDDFWRQMSPGSTPPSGRSLFSFVYNNQNNKSILFGGIDAGSYPAGVADTYVFDQTNNVWTKMNPVSSPSKRHRHSMVYDNNADKIILYGGYDYSRIWDDTWVYDLVLNYWTNMNPITKPGVRQFHSMAYSSNSSKVILFSGWTSGGLRDDTWAYDLTTNNWTNMNPITKPSTRNKHSMVYDTNSDKIVLFGGNSGWTSASPLNDTWVYDFATNNWTQMNPVTKPDARYGHSMAYAANSDKIVLYGGYNGTTYFNDTWIYDFATNNWTQMNPVIAPSAIHGHSMAYATNSGKVMLFGGRDSPRYYDDTWAYDLNTNSWAVIVPPDPSTRYGHSSSYLTNSDDVILFGGYNGTYLGDTWVYDSTTNNWTELNPITKPSGRYDHSMVCKANSDETILFGGYNGTNLGDTWVYDLITNNWTELNPITKPSGRYGHFMVCKANSNKVILFGGYNGTYLGDTWIFDLTTNNWTQMSPVIKPGVRSDHSMVYDVDSEKVILFGGRNISQILNDTWIYDLATNNWTQMNPVTNPSARYHHSMVYTANSGKVILFGGYNGTYLGDTWIYDLTTNTWSQKSQLTTHPKARHSYSMNYLTSSDKVILFGGYNGAYYGDTWLGQSTPLIGTLESRLTYFRVILSIKGEFTWNPLIQPADTELRFQVGLSNTTKTKDFHYTNYYPSNFTFSGVALYLKYRAIFESDTNRIFSPMLKRINIFFSFEPLLERITVIKTIGVTELPPSETTTDTGAAASSTFPGMLSVLVVFSSLVFFIRRRKKTK